MTKKRFYQIWLCICIALMVLSIISLGIYYLSAYMTDYKQKEVSTLLTMQAEQQNTAAPNDNNTDEVNTNYENLLNTYPDYVGWISVPGTKIDYPVMQHSEPDTDYFYLDHDHEGEENRAGSIFVNAACDLKSSTDNPIVYGHNMKSGIMFHDLLKFEDASFGKDTYITFNSIYEDGIYKVIAAFRTRVSDTEPSSDEFFRYYEYIDLSDEVAFNEYVETCKRLSLYENGTAEYGDQLITLSTCSYGMEDGSERFVVVAKKLDI